ncbi:MAG TPA: hypothetical protein PLZ84_01215, partial [Clostridia bacterium]|nr:hypothetical protein [Clostridia bacterium]
MKRKKMKKWVKDLIAWGVTIAIIGSAVLYYSLQDKLTDLIWLSIPDEEITEVFPEGPDYVVGDKVYTLAMKNSNFEFYISEKDTDFIIKDLKSGIEWFSNPASRDPSQPVGDVYKSQLNLSYYTETDKGTERDTFSHAVKPNNERIKSLEEGEELSPEMNQVMVSRTADGKGIRVIYRLGRIWKDYPVPFAMYKDDFEAIFN